MQQFLGSVAVVTGAAGGIGYALAEAALARGARVVISDIRADALAAAEQRLQAKGEVLAVLADVSKAEDMQRLAAQTLARFGKVNLLVNNAGVFVAGVIWETPLAEYDWIVDVNQRSVLHGIRAFVPRMIAQGDPCHVLTIASGAALTVLPGYASYSSTKHAALALTEALYVDLAAQNIANIGVTVAMPGIIGTGIMEPQKTSPAALRLADEERFANPTVERMEKLMRAHLPHAMEASHAAERMFAAIEAGELYVLPAYDHERARNETLAVGTGRATGTNRYNVVLDSVLASLAKVRT